MGNASPCAIKFAVYSGIEIIGDLRQGLWDESPPSRSQDEEGDHFVVDTSPLEQLGVEYRQYLWDRIPESDEWESTSIFMQYVAMDVVEIRLQGFQPIDADEPVWGLDILFSSCGGTAHESARLAAHWALIWYNQEKTRIDGDFLIPFGFTPNDSTVKYIGTPDIAVPRGWNRKQRCPQFVPIAGGSYAAFDPSRQFDEDDSPFQLNCALAESLDDCGQELLVNLQAHYGEALKDGRCRCQLCSPQLDPSAVDCRTT